MPRKPKPLDYTQGYNEGYATRARETIEFDLQYWRWGEWGLYVIATVITVGAALAIFGLLTLWIGWASDHSAHPHCHITSDGSQWCTSD